VQRQSVAVESQGGSVERVRTATAAVGDHVARRRNRFLAAGNGTTDKKTHRPNETGPFKNVENVGID